MSADSLLLGLDQGTSSTKAILMDADGRVVARAAAPIGQTHPQPGWVEQSATEIWTSVRSAVAECVGSFASRVQAVGISNQRETVVLWDRRTGEPLGPVLSWQDSRARARAAELHEHADAVRSLSGLPLDPMFSALKASWLLDEFDGDRARSRRGELCIGTIDAWLLSRFGGEAVIEIGNAARTQLFNVSERRWDPQLLELFDVPEEALPKIVPSTGPFPPTQDLAPLPSGIPVTAVLGDSHAALYAHAGWRPGYVKATYGTGASVMGLVDSQDAGGSALCRTIAWDDGQPAYALEGNIRSAGSTLVWLASLLDASVDELVAGAAKDSAGVNIVPAFGGLGAPWWDPTAVGLIDGLTLGSGPAQLASAALDSIALQVEDVVAAIDAGSARTEVLLADGGATENHRLMQLQADLSGRQVEVANGSHLSAIGVTHLAGRSAGVWTSDELDRMERPRTVFTPGTDSQWRTERLASWHQAIERARQADAKEMSR
jgi:glycerol kinase